MITEPIISIIIPVYNNVAELELCLEALRQNELIDKSEIIVIDDCSPDAGEAIKQVSRKHHIRYC